MKRSQRYVHAEIRTRVVVTCRPTRYQLDLGETKVGRREVELGVSAVLKSTDTLSTGWSIFSPAVLSQPSINSLHRTAPWGKW